MMSAEQMREEWEQAAGGDAQPRWADNVRRFTLDDCDRLKLQPIARYLLWRKLTTIITSRGGVGKSRAMVQLVTESSIGRPVWGLPDFAIEGPPPKWLVVFGEDPVEMIAGVIRPPLQHYGLSDAPFASLCADDLPNGDLTLSEINIEFLIGLVLDLRIDAVAIDTLVSILPELSIIDPVAVRRWLKRTIGRLQRETGVAVLLVTHEAASGNMVSGTLDWQNFGRLVLHLENKPAEGLVLTPGKDNTGFPFARIRLDRDPDTLITTVVESDRIVDRIGRRSGDPFKAMAEVMLFRILPLPIERRMKASIEPELFAAVKDNGIKRQQVRDFINTRIKFEEFKRNRTVAQVAVGLNDAPNGGER